MEDAARSIIITGNATITTSATTTINHPKTRTVGAEERNRRGTHGDERKVHRTPVMKRRKGTCARVGRCQL